MDELTPLEQLKKLNVELAEQNRINARLLEKPLHTIRNLVSAATAGTKRVYVQNPDKTLSVIKYRTGGRAIRNIIEAGN